MSKIIPFILTTAIGFAMGVGAGVWIGRTPVIPAPLDELKDAAIGSNNPAPARDPARDEAYRQIRAEMDAFRIKIDEMKRSLHAQMEPILTPEQRDRIKHWRERPAPPQQPAQPPKNEPPRRGRHAFWEGFDSAMTIMMVPFSLERLNDRLDLTPEQKEALHKLLLERRAKFLELVDTTPPPSYKVLKLAPKQPKPDAPKK